MPHSGWSSRMCVRWLELKLTYRGRCQGSPVRGFQSPIETVVVYWCVWRIGEIIVGSESKAFSCYRELGQHLALGSVLCKHLQLQALLLRSESEDPHLAAVIQESSALYSFITGMIGSKFNYGSRW